MRKSQQGKRAKLLEDPRIGSLPADRALLTPKEVSRALKVSPRTLSYWTVPRRGRRPVLPSVKIGKLRRYVVADVLRLIEEFKVAAA